MLVVIHEDDGVALFAEVFVVVIVVARGKSDHELQVGGVERGGEFRGELAEVNLAGIGNFLEVHHDAGLVSQNGVFGDILNEKAPGSGISEQGGHLVDAPDSAVVVIEHAHHRQLNRRIERPHPLVKLVPFQEGDGFRGSCFHGTCLVVRVVHDGESAVGCYAVQLLGDEQVEIFVVLLERRQAVGVPTYVESGAQRVVAFWNFADVGHAAVAAFAPRGRFFLRGRFQRVKRRLNLR